jgi:hypothetical protein
VVVTIPPTIKALKDAFTQDPYYEAPGPPPVLYRRIVGGLCWAGPDAHSPGNAVCVLGEERDKDFSTGHNIVRVLHESQAPSVEELLDLAARLQETMKCSLWVTPLDSPEQGRVQSWSRERAVRRAPRLTMVGPASVDFIVLHNLALKRTVSVKTLFMGDNSMAATQYVGIRSEDFYRPARMYPHVAACLYALSAVDMRAVRGNWNQKPHVAAEAGY